MTIPPLSISWSQIRAHEECKQKAFLLRSGKRSAAKNIRTYLHGMVVDRVMRDWLADPAHPTGAMTAMVDEMINTVVGQAVEDGDGVVRWKSSEDRADMREFCIELVRRLEPILHQLVLPYPYESAKRFSVPVIVPYLDGTQTVINLTGEMDLLTREPAGWVVWDLKGTRDDQYFRKVLGQLFFYDLAVLALHGEPTLRTGLIQPMCTQPVLTAAVSDKDRRGMWSRILRVATDIWNADTTCRPDTSHCTWCEVRHACQRFRPTGNTMSLSAQLRETATQGEPS